MHKIDPSLKEKSIHGNFLFPIQNYHCVIPKNFSILPMHWHEEMEITLFKKGCALYHINLNPCFVQENDILILPPFCLHDIHQIDHQPMESDSFVFHLDLLHLKSPDVCSIKYLTPLFDGRYASPYLISPQDKHYPEILMLFRDLEIVYNTKSIGYELRIKAILFNILAIIFSESIITENTSITLTQIHTDKLRIVLEYIENHLNMPLCIEELALLCNFTPYYFMKFFKKCTGLTCIEYINTKRLEICATALRDTKIPIMDIALESGFNNISYFNKCFKAKYKMTPRNYRLVLQQS